MKYGIRATREDGTVLYAHSTTGKMVALSPNITSIALFTQEKSAVAAIKSARKNGAESKHNCILDVIAVDFVVSRVIEVPQPTKKSGWVIHGERGYYTGTLKATNSYYDVAINDWWNYVEKATVFIHKATAEARIQELRVLLQRAHEDAKAELEKARQQKNGHVSHMGWMSPVEQAKSAVESREKLWTSSYTWKLVAV